MRHKGILIVVSGFSGAGKGTLMKKLLETYDNYALSVSMTTRSPREGESDGVEYFFSTKEVFEKEIESGGLIEYARYCDHYYGTPKAYVEEQLLLGKDVILEIEIQGALKIKNRFPEALLLFVTPPSIAELERRLTSRGTETKEVIKKRLIRAAEEAQGIDAYDFLVINDDLERCVQEIHEIVTASRNAPFRNTEFMNHIKEELEALSKGEN